MVYRNILIKRILFFILLLFPFSVTAQDGPGGIGNASGADGHPELLFWLSADSTSYVNGNNVNSWPDLSGNNNDFSQLNSGEQPSFISDGINGKPAIQFDGTDMSLIDEDGENYINDQSAVSLISVIQSDATGTDAGFFDGQDPDGNDDVLVIRYDDEGFNEGGNDVIKAGITVGGETNMESSENLQTTSPQMVAMQWSSGSEIDLYVNGDYKTPTDPSDSPDGSISGATKAIVGKGSMDAGSSWYGKIGEIFLYANKLNSARRTIVENYLSTKYGITIGNDKMEGDTAGYVYDLTGIGRESDGDHPQTVSSGVYLQQNGSFEAGDYLMMAHNNATNDVASIRTGSKITNAGAEAAWNRDWYMEKTGNLDVRISFNIPEAVDGGNYPQTASDYVLLYRNDTSADYNQVITGSGKDGSDEVYFDVSDVDLKNGYYTLGTLDQAASPVEGEQGRTWYTLVSGDWSNPEIWTLDPSGALPDNPNNETPNASTNDNVVILTGRTVTVNSDGLENANLTVEGRLDLQGTQNHSFTTINGGGRILLSGDHFPSGDASDFVTEGEGEGTVEYYGTSFILSTSHTFYDVEVNMSSGSESLVITSDYTLNGDLLLTQGDFQINNASNTNPLDLDVTGDVTVNSGASVSVGTADAYDDVANDGYGNYHKGFHEFLVGGDFTNNGTVRMTNLAVPDYANRATNGAVSLVMYGATDSRLACNNTTDLYNLVVDKGSDRTYELELYADGKDDFALFGQNDDAAKTDDPAHPENRKALWIANGTLRLTGSVYIPSLTEGTSDFTIGERAALILDGSNVTVHNTADDEYSDYTGLSHGQPDGIDNGEAYQAIYPYGKLQVNAGYYFLGEGEAINFRDAAPGIIEINGGTLEANQIAISSGASTAEFAYTQTGGEVHLNAEYNYDGNNAMLNLDQPDMNFTMKGGDLYIRNTTGHDPNAIHISSTEGNYNITGGTLHLDVGSNMQVRSTAPFYNLLVYNGSTATLQDSLTVLNDLTIQDGATLDAAGYGLAIGGNFELKDPDDNGGGVFTHGGNTTHFIGDQTSHIRVRNTTNSGELTFNNLKISKEQRYDPSLYHSVDVHSGSGRSADQHPVEIGGNLTIDRGEFDVNEWEVDLKGNLKITDGNILYGASTGYVVMNNASSSQSIIGTTGGSQNFGNLEFVNSNGITLLNNVDANDIRLNAGPVNLDIYNLDISGDLTTTGTLGQSSLFFITAGNASDGGLTRYIDFSQNGAGSETLYPIGTGSVYNPARIIQSTNISDNGKITISPVNEYHPSATNTSKTIQYYWVTDTTGFSTLTYDQLSYTFTYNGGNIPGSVNKGLVLWPSDYTWNKFNNVVSGNDLVFPSGAYLRSDYTIGNQSEFNQPIIYYSRIPTDDYNIGSMPQWSDGDTWSTESHTGAAAGDWPKDGDIAIIGYGGSGGGTGGNRHHVAYRNTDNYDLAKVKINSSEDPDVWSSRLFIEEGSTIDMGLLEGDGTLQLYLDPANQSTISGDFGSFTTNEAEGARVLFYGAGGDPIAIPDIFNQLPNVRIEGNGTRTFNFPRELTVRGDLLVDHNATLRLDHDLTVNGDLRLGNHHEGILEFPDDVSRNVTVNSDLRLTSDGASEVTVDNSTENALEHRLRIAGNIELDQGNRFDLFTNNTGGNNVILELFGESYGEMTNSDDMPVELYRLVMNKQQGTDFSIWRDPADPSLAMSNFSINGPTDGSSKAIELNSGRLMLQDGGIDVTLTSGTDAPDFEIPSETALFAKYGATVRVKGSNTGVLLDGAIEASYNSVWQLDEGTNNYIEYTASGNASIDIFQAEFYVGSQIRRNTVTDGGVLSFTQHHPNSTVVLGTDADAGGEQSRGVLELVNDGCYFEQAAGAELSIANHVDNAIAPVLDLELADSEISLGEGSSIIFGGDSAVAGQNLGIYANQPLQNVEVSNAAGTSPTATISTVSLTADTLTIGSGATFDANGLDLTLNGDFYANGTFTSNQNTTYFSGSVTQHISGDPTFYNLIKDASNSLTINSDITVNNELRLLSGSFSDAGNTLGARDDVWMEITHNHGSSGDGILFNGNEEQTLQGEGIFGKLSVNNINGVYVPEGNTITVDDTLKMTNGVFEIGKNLLVLKENAVIEQASPFSDHNMIQTNISFTDAGVQKYFPEINSSETFIYPLGAAGKYTPVEISIDQKDAGGSIRVKAANEIHPNIIEDEEAPDPEIVDAENVLQYHWVVDAESVTNFQGNMFMKYSEEDTSYTSPYDITDYITARLLKDSTNWNKYDNSFFDQSNNRMNFDIGDPSPVNEGGISGDYTAGVDGLDFNGAIPDSVPIYYSGKNGDWFQNTTWEEDIPGGPRGAIAVVRDSVYTSSNYLVGYETRIKTDGVVDVGTTFGHRLGTVEGRGKLRLERGAMPAGVYEDFFGPDGGTIEFAGTDNYDVLSEVSNVNNLLFSGTGERRLPNLDLRLYGNLEITGGQVVNEHDHTLTVDSNIVFTGGSLDAGTGEFAKLIMNGTDHQEISGDFSGSNAWNHVDINNGSGVTVHDHLGIDGNLTFNSGKISVDASALVRINNSSSSAVSGVGSQRFVDGVLSKIINSSDNFTFPVGKGDRYGKMSLLNVSTSTSEYWRSEYMNQSPHPTYDTSALSGDLKQVSGSQYWKVTSPAGEAKVRIRWDSQSEINGLSVDPSNIRIAKWNDSQSQWVEKGSVTNGTGASGTVETDSALVFSASETAIFTLATTTKDLSPSAAITSSDSSFCAGGSTGIDINLTGESPWDIGISSDAGYSEVISGIITSDTTINVNSGGNYALDSVKDNDDPWGTNVSGSVVISEYSNPTANIVISATDSCESVSLMLDGSGSSGNAPLSYSWSSNPASNIAAPDAETTSAVPSDGNESGSATFNQDYYLTVTDDNGCQDQTTKSIEIYQTPVAEPSQNGSPLCYGNGSVQLDADSNTDSSTIGYYEYSWAPADSIPGETDWEEPGYEPGGNPSSAEMSFYMKDTIFNMYKRNCYDVDSVEVIILRKPETGNTYYVPDDFDQ
jgi:hypothetical protein